MTEARCDSNLGAPVGEVVEPVLELSVRRAQYTPQVYPYGYGGQGAPDGMDTRIFNPGAGVAKAAELFGKEGARRGGWDGVVTAGAGCDRHRAASLDRVH